MSYFGTSGPAQSGNFIHGIGAGAQRLTNARKARVKRAQSFGFGAHERKMQALGNLNPFDTWSKDSDDVLAKRAADFDGDYQRYRQALADYEEAKARDDPDVEQYEAHVKAMGKELEDSRRLIEGWAESGPYVKEDKALTSTLGSYALIGIGVFVAYKYLIKPGTQSRASKDSMYAVFS